MVSNMRFVAQSPYENLCWAACAEMTFQWLRRGTDTPLNDIVVATFGVFRDSTEYPQVVYRNIYGLNCLYLGRDQLLNEAGGTRGTVWVGQWIRADFPLQPYINWGSGLGYHTIMLSGIYADERVRVFDPASGEDAQHTFADVMDGYGQGSLEGIWYDVTVAKKG